MKLKIFGTIYRVLKTKGELPIPGASGVCDLENKIIYIAAELVGEEYQRVLIHESIHAIINRCSIDQAQLSNDTQEILCDTIAVALTENFRLVPKK